MTHEFNEKQAAEATRKLESGQGEEAIVRGLFAIADRLAELTEVFAAADDVQRARALEPEAPDAARAVAEERYGGSR